MFKTEPMQRVRIYADSEAVGQLVQALYDYGVIHITKTRYAEAREYNEPLASFREVSTMLIAARAAEKNLNLAGEGNGELNWRQVQRAYREVEVEKINSIAIEKHELNSRVATVEKELAELEPFENLILPAEANRSKLLAVIAFETKSDRQGIETALAKAKISGFSLAIAQSGKRNKTALVALEKEQLTAVQAALAGVALRILAIPAISNGSFAAEIGRKKREKSAAKSRIAEINAELAWIKRQSGKTLLNLKAALEIESKKAQVTFNFSTTKNIAIVEGWVPAAQATELESYVKKAAPLSFAAAIKTMEIAPTKLKNPRGVNSFEELVKFFSLPLSNELDPTALVAITFPLFFGMIVGDIGYGLVSLLLALAIKMKTKGNHFMQALGTMLAISSISSIIFGFIFAEFFGFESILGWQMTAIIHRNSQHGLILLMGYSLLFGMLQLALGYALGAYNAFKHHDMKHALAKISWLALEFSLSTYIASQAKVEFLFFLEPLAQAFPPIVSGELALLSIIGIIVFEGAIGVMEIPGLISNIFSYLRIMALGLSGVIIALILDGIPGAVSFADPVSAIGAVLLLALFVVGHVGAIALALFESMIQSMRLQYVEFFSKFFHGGGVPFTAFNLASAMKRADN